MCLHYESQITVPLIGTKSSANALTRVALTTVYQAEGAGAPTRSLAVGGFSKIDLAVSYSMGAAETSNTIELKIEQSPDNTNWYRIPNETVSGGTSTLTAREFVFTGTNADVATISVGLDVFYKYLKVSCKESGVAANAGSVYVEATLSGK